jgi:hypothetical protein
MSTAARIDWRIERNRIDVADVATSLLGPPGRRGKRSGKLWWRCPFGTHADKNPSFCVTPGKGWRCFGCGEKGDSAALVMRLRNLTFFKAIAYLTGNAAQAPRAHFQAPPGRIVIPTASAANGYSGVAPAAPLTLVEAAPNSSPSNEHWSLAPAAQAPRGHFQRCEPKPKPGPADERPKMTPEAALAFVEAATACLWTPVGKWGLDYLRERGLSDATIRAARLGWTSRAYDAAWKPPGIVIPWFNGPHMALIKIRTPDIWRKSSRFRKQPPKYIEACRSCAHMICYPSPYVIRPGCPVIIVEGEFDALLLAQELAELAAVVTLGGAWEGPCPAFRTAMLPASPWYIASDADTAGDLVALGWPETVRRVRPPGFKDWTDARAGGVDLRRWWSEVLAGCEQPPPFTREELWRWRWGEGPEPGPRIECSGALEPFVLAEFLELANTDPFAIAEREALQDQASP